MKKIYLLTIVTFICNSILFSQSETKHPIDKQCEACLDSIENQSTQGIVGCLWRAATAWDKELNKYYNLLMGVLDDDEKTKLKNAQKAWLAYKKVETDFYETAYSNEEGTMYQEFVAGRAAALMKVRVMELKDYYNDLTYQ